MMFDETGNGETVIFVVSRMEGLGNRGGQRKVSNEVGVDELLHQFLYAEAAGVETIIYIHEEDRAPICRRGC